MAAARDIDQEMLNLVRRDWESAPFGCKTTVVKGWAERLGVAFQTLYKALPTDRPRKKGERQLEGIEEAARVVAMLKYAAPEHRGIISTRDALENALLQGLIDPRFNDVAHSTFDRVIRELGINPTRRRICRFQAERPNEMHHVDASSSDCFYVAEALEGGDYLLRLHKGHADYKNKPIPVDGLRPWYYGVVDDHSGVLCARMVAAHGESAGDNIDFMCWAWSKVEGKCLYGLPDKIKGDHGPMMKSPAVLDLFDRLGVAVDPSVPGEKDAHGKIEVSWSKIWQSFEKTFFMSSDWKKLSITMSDLMQRFYRWTERYNSNRHRFERRLTKKQAWDRISLSGGAVILPEDALKTVVRRWQRNVDQAGCLSIDSQLYEVKGLHDAKVWVLAGLFDEKMVAIDKADGRKYEVIDFAPNALGEFHAAPDTGYQKTRKAAALMEGVENRLYTDQHMEKLSAAEPKNVVKIPTRVKEVRSLANPLETSRHPSLAVALRAFQGVCGFILDRDDRLAVGALIEEHGLSIAFVKNLALEVQVERERRVVG